MSLSFCSLNANVPLKIRKISRAINFWKHCTFKKKKSSVVRLLFIYSKIFYPYHTARRWICWINGKPFVFSQIMSKLSCASPWLLLTVDLFDWQGTAVVIVLFIAGYLLRVENIFVDGPPDFGIALLFFLCNNFADYPETVRRKT